MTLTAIVCPAVRGASANHCIILHCGEGLVGRRLGFQSNGQGTSKPEISVTGLMVWIDVTCAQFASMDIEREKKVLKKSNTDLG